MFVFVVIHIDRVLFFQLSLKAYFSYQYSNMDSFDQSYNIFPVTICFALTKTNKRSSFSTSKITQYGPSTYMERLWRNRFWHLPKGTQVYTQQPSRFSFKIGCCALFVFCFVGGGVLRGWTVILDILSLWLCCNTNKQIFHCRGWQIKDCLGNNIFFPDITWGSFYKLFSHD